MFRRWHVYMGANDYVDMTEGLDSSMLATLGQRRRRRFLTGIVLVLALFILTVWTVSTPRAMLWLARVAPPVAQFIDPSMGSQEESGIRLDVAEVTREGDELLVHLTMEDLRADRLNAAAYPKWLACEQEQLRVSGDCTRKYDEETGLLHLHLNLTCRAGFDWERWITVTICGLHTSYGELDSTWTIQVSPTTAK